MLRSTNPNLNQLTYGRDGFATLFAFQACATLHYRARVAQRHGHQIKIIPAKAVTPSRQSHKTDQNDALAVAEAASRPNVKLAPLKTIEQQGMQAVPRSTCFISGCAIFART